YIAELDKPLHLYLIMPQRDEMSQNMLTLLAELREINPRYVNFEEISPTLNRGRISELAKKFPQLTNYGLIVAMGEKEDNYSVIPTSELENEDFNQMTGQREQRQFNGEVRLMQELMYLGENKKKPVVYITQGHGEPDVTDPRDDGMATLQLKLMRANFDVRQLKIAA